MAEPVFVGNELVPLLYSELRKLARSSLARLRPGQSLQPTELVHEMYLRLGRQGQIRWDSRAHFFGAAAQAMRRVLVDHARRKGAEKRGGDRVRLELPEDLPGEQGQASSVSVADILAVHEALEQLQADHPRKAEIVMLRCFAGLSVEEIAELMEVTTRTVERDWKFARAWLELRLTGEAGG